MWKTCFEELSRNDFRNKFGNLYFSIFLEVFLYFYTWWCVGMISRRRRLLQVRRGCVGMISGQVCKNLFFDIFWIFSLFLVLAVPDRGFSRFWTKKYVGYAICIADTTHLGIGHTILYHSGSISYVWKCFQWFLESLTDGLFFNLDFAENFV